MTMMVSLQFRRQRRANIQHRGTGRQIQLTARFTFNEGDKLVG